MTTVNWVLDGNSNYEVSSKEHLIQMMNNGSVYSNSGSTPTSWGGSQYIQTADIDLLGDSTNIKPFNLSGEYNGAGFTISNWVFVDDNYGESAAITNFVGLFETISGTVKNVRMAGVCSISGFSFAVGMLAGQVSGGDIFNIEVDLDAGSFIKQEDYATTVYMGTIVGYMAGSTTSATAVTFKGQMDEMTFSPSAIGTVHVGGIVGYARTDVQCTLLRNLGVFLTPLKGQRVGGIVGYSNDANFTKLLNAMTGDIQTTLASGYAGGICGYCMQDATAQNFNNCVNSMTGNITAVSDGYVGGITGALSQNGTSVFGLLNYMTGDITNATSPYKAAGIASFIFASTNITSSMNAMNGTVYYSVASGTNTLAHIDKSYGLVSTIDNAGTTEPLTGLAIQDGLPVVDLSVVDPDSVAHTFDFIFGNSENSVNSVNSGPVELLVVAPRVSSVFTTIAEFEGATSYSIIVKNDGTTVAARNNVSLGDIDIGPLTPDTTYTVEFLADSVTVATETFTTLQNISSNYDKTAFDKGGGKFDLSTTDLNTLNSVIDDVFSTGEKLILKVGSKSSTVSFVKLGETIPIPVDDSVFASFDENNGSGQQFSLSLADSSVVAVSYDESTNSISIGSENIGVGESVVVDGIKCTVVSF